MNAQLSKWLASGENSLCSFQKDGNTYFLIRVEKNADFDYLYGYVKYVKTRLTRNEDFNYLGIYCKRDGLLYGLKGFLKRWNEQNTHSCAELLKQLEVTVRQLVEKAIDNDRRNLRATAVTSPQLDAELLHSTKEYARRRYLDLDEYETQDFQCEYCPDRWTEDSLLEYILDPKRFAEKEAATYIENNQEEMLYSFLLYDARQEAYQALLNDPENSIHTIKKIIAALRDSPAKTVKVTINKDGKSFTFQTSANVLRRDCGNAYSTYKMNASDRREYDKLFGRYTDYTPDEITRITYGKNTLYETGS